MRLWRIATATRSYGADDLSGIGASKRAGRWNADGEKVLYCATTVSLAVLETAAHIDTGGLPMNRYIVAIDVPHKAWAARETLDVSALDPTWDAIPPGLVSVEAGSAWLRSGRSSVLLVPSVIVPEEFAVLVNPSHPDVAAMRATVVRKFEYDTLFRPPTPT